MGVHAGPGHLTTAQYGMSGPEFVARGWKWIAFQVQNGGMVKTDYRLDEWAAVGANPGVWGVVYDKASFFEHGKLLGMQAVTLSAKHVQMDVEECAKFTRATRGCKPIIDGIRSGGWKGPVSINTIGAPSNPAVNDFEIDVQSFLDTGGDVIHQDYFNEDEIFRPKLCMDYWRRMGVPDTRQNCMIGLHMSGADKAKPNLRLAGADWVPLLKEAGVNSNLSIFMTEFGNSDDWVALEPLAKWIPPTSSEIKAQMIVLAQRMEDEWHRTGVPQATINKQRIPVARILLQTDDPTWQAARDEIRAALGITP